MAEPLLCEWTDEGTFKPLGRHAKACDAQYVVGQRYIIEPEEPRSMSSHRAYFAQISEAWRNLPEDIAEQFSDAEKLRKYALCKTGFCRESRQVYTTPRDAIMASAWAAAGSEYAIVDCSGRVVTIWIPESQSVKAMGDERWKKSRKAVLDFVSGMVGVTPLSLSENAGKAA